MDDIFEHTDSRILYNMRKIVEYYNKNKGEGFDPVAPDLTLEKILETDIAFPNDYKPILTFVQLVMQTQKKKERIEKNQRQEALRP